jgi:hypothetical protein
LWHLQPKMQFLFVSRTSIWFGLLRMHDSKSQYCSYLCYLVFKCLFLL